MQRVAAGRPPALPASIVLTQQAVNRAEYLITDARERLFITACDPRQKAVNGRLTQPPVLTAHRRRLRARRAGTALVPYSHGFLTSHQ